MVDLSPSAGVAIGILVGIASTCIQSIGLTQQRKSHLLEEQKQDDGHVQRPPYRRRRWQLGMLAFLIANIVGSSIQITTLPLPVLSTLQASGLVFNTICATVILGEPFTRYSLVGTILVAIGAVLIGIFGSVTEPSHNLNQLLVLLGRGQFLMWLFGTFFVAVLIIASTFMLKRLPSKNTHRMRLIRGMAYGSASGILSAHCLLLAKSAVELLVRTIADRNNQFNRWQSWMILLGLVFLALTQLYYLHRGLKLCSTSVLYPFVFCIYNIVAILDGLIYFDQGSRLPVRDAALIAVGTAVLLGGVFALSWRLQEDENMPGPSVVDVKAPARVLTPRTILQPGLGLADESEEDSDEESPLLRPGDEEATVRPSRSSETTPLLRTKTASAWQEPKTRRKNRALTKGSLRPGKLRKSVTTNEETNDLWDELNDRGNRRSGEYSPHSMRSPSFSKLAGRRSASGGRRAFTLPPRRLSGSERLSKMGWGLWDSGRGKSHESLPVGRDPASPPGASEPTDGEDTEGEQGMKRRSLGWNMGGDRGRGSGTSTSEDPGNGWFKMKWWKKRWKSGDEEEILEGGQERA
ncbi:hypothetical protein EG328_008199 [Venturia inaequalis]|uniref:DUF803 domain-containing protein n=1 Tax=Venturia inaequalis TaxID=5025 RepID=A0A8H3YS35_VENIN|nr:hypothetical protein EG328_008199 [Venturia inaequalis]RDI86697.1 hypothetical protein Vi05172_g3580 [Venturia inaequalis]